MVAITLVMLSVAAPIPKDARTDAIVVVTVGGNVQLFDDRGRELLAFKLAHDEARFVRLAPDRKAVVYAVKPDAKKPAAKLFVQKSNEKNAALLSECQHLSALFWLPDGSGVVGSGLDIIKGNLPQNFRHQCWLSWKVHCEVKKETYFDLDGEYRFVGMTADDKLYIAVRTFDPKPVANRILAPQVETWLVDPKTLKLTLAIPAETDAMPIAMLPDGKRWLVRKTLPGDTTSRVGILKTDKNEIEILEGQKNAGYSHVVVSRDGKTIFAAEDRSIYSFDGSGGKRGKFLEMTEPIRELEAK